MKFHVNYFANVWWLRNHFFLNFLIFAANMFRYKRDDILFTLNEFELKTKRQEEFLSKEKKFYRDTENRMRLKNSAKMLALNKKKLPNFFRYLLAGNRRKKTMESKLCARATSGKTHHRWFDFRWLDRFCVIRRANFSRFSHQPRCLVWEE